MYVVREIMHCKPGKVRPLIEKFKAMSEIMVKLGHARSRILTDLSGAPYWTIISEMEVESLDAYLKFDEKAFVEAGGAKLMEGYHDLVDHGCREILKLES